MKYIVLTRYGSQHLRGGGGGGGGGEGGKKFINLYLIMIIKNFFFN